MVSGARHAATLEAVAGILAGARDVLVLTGAGVSADSGLPTYRGIGGLYDGMVTESGREIEDVLSGATFRREPALTWRYVREIEAACRGARFNRAHEVLAEMSRRYERLVILTQNVDGFHQDAGAEDVVDIHGDLRTLICTRRRCTWTARVDDYRGLQQPVPRCPECGGVVRPDVVLFGEMLPLRKVERMDRELSRGFDAVLSIGTTSAFPYIAGPVAAAARARVPTVEINPGDSEVSHLVTHRLRLGAAEALDGLWRAITSR